MTEFSGDVNYDTVVESCLSDSVRQSIPDSWGKKFAGKSMDDVFTSHLNAEKEFSQRVKIPGDDTSDEDRRKFHTQCGCPETSDGYEFELPDDHDKDFVQWARDTFHKAGVSKRKAASLVKGFNEYSGARQAEMKEAQVAEATKAKEKADKAKAKVLADSETTLREEYKEDYQANIAKARVGYEGIFGEGAREKLAKAGLNHDPDIVKAVVAHVDKLGEDAFVKGGKGKGKGKETTQQMLDRHFPDDPRPGNPNK